MMGTTHGLAGVAAGGGLVLALRGAGADVTDTTAVIVVITAAIAAELPDLDLRTSRISGGRSTLAAVPVISRVALLLTLPLVLAGVGIRAAGADHRGPTHSLTAAALWTLAIVPLYVAYFAGAGELAQALATVPGTGPVNTAATQAANKADLLMTQASGAWLAAAPLAAIATLLAYLSHLLLDELTPATQALLWPARRDKLAVLSRPNIPVGGGREALLVALPLAALAAGATWSLTADARQRVLPDAAQISTKLSYDVEFGRR